MSSNLSFRPSWCFPIRERQPRASGHGELGRCERKSRASALQFPAFNRVLNDKNRGEVVMSFIQRSVKVVYSYKWQIDQTFYNNK